MSTTITARIAPIPKGDWSNSIAYSMLDIVTHEGASYIAKKTVPAGTAVTDTTYWQYFAAQGVKGNVMFATFAIDPLTGILTETYDSEYSGATFALVNGYLEVTV